MRHLINKFFYFLPSLFIQGSKHVKRDPHPTSVLAVTFCCFLHKVCSPYYGLQGQSNLAPIYLRTLFPALFSLSPGSCHLNHDLRRILAPFQAKVTFPEVPSLTTLFKIVSLHILPTLLLLLLLYLQLLISHPEITCSSSVYLSVVCLLIFSF